MLNSAITRIVELCALHCWRVFVSGLLLAAAAITYDVECFSITTNTETLIAKEVAWRQRQAAARAGAV